MNRIIRFFILVGCLCCLPAYSLWAQPSAPFQLRILPLDAPVSALQKIKLPSEFKDSTELLASINRLVAQLHGQSFLEASVDTLAYSGNRIYTAFVHLGPSYRWMHLAPGNADESLSSAAGYRERLYRGQAFSYKQVARLQEALLTTAENNGYPFVKVGFDSVHIDQGQLEAQLNLKLGPLIRWSDIKIEGDARLSQDYLEHYLGLRPGLPYDRSRLLRLRERLRGLPFLSMSKDPEVTFIDQRAKLRLFLERRNASRFDFIIGILPNSRQVGRLLLTGAFNGELHNQFGRGERILARFEQLRPQTQRLDLRFTYPYAFSLPFGADVQFNLYKRDTNYIDLEYDLGVQYLLEGGNFMKVFWNNRSTNLLSIDANRIASLGVLPDTLDVSYSSFGLEIQLQRLDYRFNPRKGWNLSTRVGAGVKRIQKNNQIEALGYVGLYDSIILRSFQYRLVGLAEAYLPLFRRSALKGALQVGFIIAETPAYANELFRIGGNRLLRGFDEEFLFALNYQVFTLEYRMLLGQNSFLFGFADIARLDERSAGRLASDQTIDYPKGIGAGITFETRAGLFAVSLAFGARQAESFDFGAPKVHFGYVSMF